MYIIYGFLLPGLFNLFGLCPYCFHCPKKIQTPHLHWWDAPRRSPSAEVVFECPREDGNHHFPRHSHNSHNSHNRPQHEAFHNGTREANPMRSRKTFMETRNAHSICRISRVYFLEMSATENNWNIDVPGGRKHLECALLIRRKFQGCVYPKSSTRSC